MVFKLASYNMRKQKKNSKFFRIIFFKNEGQGEEGKKTLLRKIKLKDNMLLEFVWVVIDLVDERKIKYNLCDPCQSNCKVAIN